MYLHVLVRFSTCTQVSLDFIPYLKRRQRRTWWRDKTASPVTSSGQISPNWMFSAHKVWQYFHCLYNQRFHTVFNLSSLMPQRHTCLGCPSFLANFVQPLIIKAKDTCKTGLSPQVFLYWPFQGGTSVVVPYCSCCLCLYFGSSIMLVIYFVNFR